MTNVINTFMVTDSTSLRIGFPNWLGLEIVGQL